VTGLFVLAGWVLVGIVVAAVDRSTRRQRDIDESMVTIFAVAGAIAGGAVGQVFRFYVFGEVLGFIFSAAGALLLLSVYRSRTHDATPAGAATPDEAAVAAPPASDPLPTVSVASRSNEAFACGALSAFAVAVGGFCGLMTGGAIYTQRNQQFPPVLFFVPLGVIAGFIAGGAVRLVRPQWGKVEIAALLAVLYAGLMVNYAKANAGPVHLELAFEPDPGAAGRCDDPACSQTNPALEWTVHGTLQLKETSGPGLTLEWIALSSQPDRSAVAGQDLARRVRENIWGPNVKLSGEQITGPRRLRPNQVASYPFQYSYRTGNADSRRIITIQVGFTDSAGRFDTDDARWTVR